jgi:hypothetical protein
MRPNSSGVRPCSATSSGVTGGSTVALGIDRPTLTELGLDTTRSFSRYESNICAARAVESLKPKKKGHMKNILLSIVCALAAPLAFGQTTTTTTEQTTTQPTTTTETTTTYTAGTVTTYEPGKTIVVKSDEGPVSFALGTAARVVNGAGHVVSSALKPGQRVRVYYTGPTERRTVERVIVED